MKGYRKVSGEYIEVADLTPVSASLIAVALRPTVDHVFTASWADSPLDPTLCWRVKTAAEVTAGKDADLQIFLDSVVGKVVKAIIQVLIEKGIVTLADLRAKYRTF